MTKKGYVRKKTITDAGIIHTASMETNNTTNRTEKQRSVIT